MIVFVLTVISVIWCVKTLAVCVEHDEAVVFYFEKYIFPFHTAALLGIAVGQSGYGSVGMVDFTNRGLQYTLFNISEWTEMVRWWLVAFGISILFMAFIQIFWTRRPKLFIRDMISMCAVFMACFGIARGCTQVDGWLNFLLIPVHLVAFILYFSWLISAGVWLIPARTLAALNRDREARERAATVQKRHQTSDNDMTQDEPDYTPAYVTDDDGNQYPVEMRGDYIVIRGSHGEVSTRWEYVKGQPYFDLGGTRFFPH